MTYEEKIKQARKQILKLDINKEKEIIQIYEATSKEVLRVCISLYKMIYTNS